MLTWIFFSFAIDEVHFVQYLKMKTNTQKLQNVLIWANWLFSSNMIFVSRNHPIGNKSADIWLTGKIYKKKIYNEAIQFNLTNHFENRSHLFCNYCKIFIALTANKTLITHNLTMINNNMRLKFRNICTHANSFAESRHLSSQIDQWDYIKFMLNILDQYQVFD